MDIDWKFTSLGGTEAEVRSISWVTTFSLPERPDIKSHWVGEIIVPPIATDGLTKQDLIDAVLEQVGPSYDNVLIENHNVLSHRIAMEEIPPLDSELIEPSEPTIYEANRRQILTALGILGWISEVEAEAALTSGARPAAVEAIISLMPEAERFAARMKWAGFQMAYISDPLVLALAAHEDKTEEDIATLFTMAAQIE